MNREEIRELINLIAKAELEVIRSPNFKELTDPLKPLSSMGIDSLEYMMLYMHLSDLLGIDKDRFRTIEVVGDVQLRTITDFLMKEDTRGLSLKEAQAEYLTDR
jgi:acyl carrier protein